MEVIDIVQPGIPGPAGTITPEAEEALADGIEARTAAQLARDAAREARDAAQVFAAGAQALQDGAVAGVLTGQGQARKVLDQGYMTRQRRGLNVAGGGSRVRGRTNGLRRTARGRELDMFDAAQEWWCGPVTTRIRRMTYGLHYSSTGEIIAWDRHDRDGVHSVVIGEAGATGPGGEVDDHDAGARLMLADASLSVAVWQNHGDDEYLRFRVSYDGTADGFMDYAEVAVSVGANVQVSYNQIALHSADANTVVLWVKVRVGPGWGWQIVTINRNAHTVTKGAFLRGIQISGQQPYGAQVVDGRTLRIAYYVNPAYSIHAIWLLEVNMDTRAVVNARTGQVIGNLDDNAYIELTNHTPFVPETAANASRRLFYPHPKARRVLFADWNKAGTGPDEAVYREAILWNDSIILRDLGVAGPRNGYTADANYIPGACYSPDGSIVVTAHNTPQGGEIHAHSTSMSWVTALTDHAVSRPLFVQGDGGDEITWLAVDYYSDYFDFQMSLLSQVGLPVLELIAIVADHPLSKGAVWLMEPGYSSWRTSAWDGLPTKVKSLADGTECEVTYPTTSGARIERTVKGALLFEGSTAATSNQSVAISGQQAIAFMAANPTHNYVLAVSYAISREPASGYVPAVGHRMLGLITGAPADLANVRVGPTRGVVSGFKNTGEVTAGQNGNTTKASGAQLVIKPIDGFTGTPGSSTAMEILHNGGAGSPAPARADYFAVVVDRTASGETYDQVAARIQAYHNQVHGTGGRYAGDTWSGR